MSLQQKIRNVIAKTSKLVEQNRKLQVKNAELENELTALRALLDEEGRKMTELNNQIKIIKLARNIGSTEEGPEIAELKRKINEYIKEIDHCVVMLND
jgi:uncharacterized coiled-coil DUF342 family protein